MNKKLIVISIVISFFLVGCGVVDNGGSPPSSSSAIFTSVDPQWSVSLVYEHDFVYPQSICVGPNGDAFVLDKTLGKIFKVASSDKTVSEYYDLGVQGITKSDLRCMAWQPNAQRFLIGVSDKVYTYTPGTGRLELLASGYSQGWSFFEVASSNDDIYASSQTTGTDIYKYNANMGSQVVMDSNTNGAYQMAYVASENVLYYTETYTGTLKKIDTTNPGSSVTVLSGLGILNTYEPITVEYNPNTLTINVFDAVNGIQTAGGTSLMLADSGVGNMCWWDAAGSSGAMVMLQNAGANIIWFDIGASDTKALTQYMNSDYIARMANGDILLQGEDYISKLTPSGKATYYTNSGVGLRTIMNDVSGNIYAAWADGDIEIITDTGAGIGTSTPWATGITGIVDMAHNATMNLMIVLRESATDTLEVLRVDMTNPASRNIMATLNNVQTNSAEVVCGHDDDGAIYVLAYDKLTSPEQANILRYNSDGSYDKILQSDIFSHNVAIAVPSLVYASETRLLIVSGIEDIRAYPACGVTLAEATFAVSNGAVDIFGLTEDKDGDIVGIQAGRVFRFSAN